MPLSDQARPPTVKPKSDQLDCTAKASSLMLETQVKNIALTLCN